MAEKVGFVPLIGLLNASLRVIVMVEVEVPSGFTGPVPVIVDVAALGTSGIKEIAPPDFATGVRSCGILLSAFVDFRVQVEFPEASVAEQAL